MSSFIETNLMTTNFLGAIGVFTGITSLETKTQRTFTSVSFLLDDLRLLFGSYYYGDAKSEMKDLCHSGLWNTLWQFCIQ